MLLHYLATYQEFLAARRLSRGRSRKIMAWYLVTSWGFPAIGVLSGVTLLRAIALHAHRIGLGNQFIFATVAMFALSLVLAPRWIARTAYRRYIRPQRGGADLELTGDQIISRIAGRSEARFSRVALAGFEEDQTVAIVYLSPLLYLIIPKRTMNQSQVLELRQWMQASPKASAPC